MGVCKRLGPFLTAEFVELGSGTHWRGWRGGYWATAPFKSPNFSLDIGLSLGKRLPSLEWFLNTPLIGLQKGNMYVILAKLSAVLCPESPAVVQDDKLLSFKWFSSNCDIGLDNTIKVGLPKMVIFCPVHFWMGVLVLASGTWLHFSWPSVYIMW